ncbi:MAG: MarR family transcriptional regulator [Clostridia bacterium]|nr:MarR family transcriptional regulator [Clostridia bacterium]
MEVYTADFEDVLIETYHALLRVESALLRRAEAVDITSSEMNILAILGRRGETGLTVSQLAAELGITLPSVTAAVNKLEKKGYVNKEKSKFDGRVVTVRLTREGERLYVYQKYYFKNTIKALSKGFSDAEKECFRRGIAKMHEVFKETLLKGTDER